MALPFNGLPLDGVLQQLQSSASQTPLMPTEPPQPPMGQSPSQPGANFGAIAKQAFPMILALLARKQGGPEAGAGLLDGITRGLATKRQAEKEAHELELQTLQSDQERQDRIADRKRQEAIQRANWLTNLQKTLAEIDDPVAFASTRELADKVGTSAFGMQPGEITRAFQFPKSRETAALAKEAKNVIAELKGVHKEQFDGLVASNATFPFRGKQTPVRDIMSVAGVLATDDKGQAVLPTSKADAPKGEEAVYADLVIEFKEKHGRTPRPGAESRGLRTQARKEYMQSDDRPRVQPIVIRNDAGLTPSQELSNVRQLQVSWDKLNAPYREMSRQYTIMKEGIGAAKRGDMNAGSQMVLVTFQKILDPTSVVRESEYARSAEGISLMERIRGAKERLERGGAGVTVPELESMVRAADQMLRALKSETSAHRLRTERTAKRFGIDPGLVFEGDTASPSASATEFSVVAPDGKTYTFPSQAALDAFKKKAGIQ